MTALRIADHPVTPDEIADLLTLLGADSQERHRSCECRCGCEAGVLGTRTCRRCDVGDCLFPEARS
jgi:hypothetical protein